MFKASLIEKNAVNSRNELVKYITAYHDEAIKNNEHLHILPGKASKTHPSIQENNRLPKSTDTRRVRQDPTATNSGSKPAYELEDSILLRQQ